MRDIAAEARVSQSTVSRVLNNAPTSVPIAEETRQRVKEAARRLGYRPNPLARGLCHPRFFKQRRVSNWPGPACTCGCAG